MLDSSAEVRWFGQGEIPPALGGWFVDGLGGAVYDEPSRIDVYLTPAAGNQGIKWRGGRLEVKWRTRSFGVQYFGASIVGNVEQWCKLGATFDADGGLDEVAGDTAWIAVEKRRTTRKYEVQHSTVLAVDPTTRPSAGCNVELTRLLLAGKPWWTIGFEAFGEKRDLLVILQSVVAHTFAEHATLSLPVADSYGYPEWLTSCTKTERWGDQADSTQRD